MKICFLTQSLKFGGYEKVLLNLVKKMNNHEISVITIKSGGELEKEFKEVCRIYDLNLSKTRYCLPKLIKTIGSIKPQIIYVAFPHLIILTFISVKMLRLKCKFIIGEHGFVEYNNMILKSMLNYIYKSSDCIITVCNELKSYLLEHFQLDKSKIKVIYNPVITEESYVLLNETVNHKWFKNYKIITSVGRLSKDKGFQDIILALNRLNNKDIKLLIIGDGPYKKELLDLIDKLNMEDQIQILGYTSNPYKYLKNSDVFVMASEREGFGNVIVEALFCNVPIIAYNCLGGPKEILDYGKYGYLIEYGNIKELSNKIKNVLEKKYKNNTHEYSKRFSDFEIANEYIEIFKKL